MPVETKKAPSPKIAAKAAPIAGRTSVVKRATEEKMKIRMQPDFFFFCSPSRWDVFVDPDDKKKFHLLPSLSRMRLLPGVSGIGSGRDGEPTNLNIAIAARESRGNILVERPLDTIAFGEPVEDYVQNFDGFFGVTYYDVWMRPFQLGSTVSFRHDKKGRIDFYRQVRDLYLGLPDESVIEVLKDNIRSQLRTQSERANASSRLFAEEMSGKLAYLEAYHGE